MSENEKKRKRSDEDNKRPKKKKTTTTTTTTTTTSLGKTRVELVENKAELGPLLAVTPGLKFPSKITLVPYRRTHSTPHGESSELLLQSSQHTHLDYVAREERDTSSENQLRDYVGVYDSAANTLQIMPVKRVTIRSTLRSETEELRQEQAELEARQNTLAAKRFALAAEFGSKKSKKALEQRTLNTIPSDAVNQNGSVAQNVLQNMATLVGEMPTEEQLALAMDSSRPRPTPNLLAESPADVYTVESVIGMELLTMLQVKDWITASDAGQAVNVTSMYVAKRMVKLAKKKQIQKLKVLRYILLCINFHASLSGGGGGMRPKKIPPKGRLEAFMGKDTPEGCVMAIRRQFVAENGDMPRWNVNKLITHIAAAALMVDDFEVDVHDLREDLKLDNQAIKSYFAELGCRVTAPSQTEAAQFKWTRAESNLHFMAKLKLPLKFPKAAGARQRRT